MSTTDSNYISCDDWRFWCPLCGNEFGTSDPEVCICEEASRNKDVCIGTVYEGLKSTPIPRSYAQLIVWIIKKAAEGRFKW